MRESILINSWTDEARAASLAVRRAKAVERKRLKFFEYNPDADEIDWEREQARSLEAWKKRKDNERRVVFETANPDGTETDWKREQARSLDAWKKRKDEERRATFYEANPDATDTDWENEQARSLEAWKKSKDEEGGKTIWTPPSEYSPEETAMFDRQHDMRRARGEHFVENWYPRGEDGNFGPDGGVSDPHFGPWSEDAPYGYHDTTGEPRTEPLYDIYGRPIVPRVSDKGMSRSERKAVVTDWLQRSDQAMEDFGYFGKAPPFWMDAKLAKAKVDQWMEASGHAVVDSEMQSGETLHFDEGKHRYTIDGAPVPGATSILRDVLGNQFESVDPVYLDWGSAAHGLYDLLAQGKDMSKVRGRLSGNVEGWQAFMETTGTEIIESEIRVGSAKHKYAGTLDLLARINDKLTVVDFKGSRSDRDKLQMAAYKVALQETRGIEVDQMVSVEINADGSWTMGKIVSGDSMLEAENEWLSILETYSKENLANAWTAESRAASLAVRRAKAVERKRLAFLTENNGATEADWKREQARSLEAWKKRKDDERRVAFYEANPGATEAEWNQEQARSLAEWKKRKDAERRAVFFYANPDATEGDWAQEQARSLAEWKQQKDEERRNAFFATNPDASDSDWKAEQAQSDKYQLQHGVGKQYESWYSRGSDGIQSDPHFGERSADAPYGYVDGTREPRTEPLYERDGQAILPRPEDDANPRFWQGWGLPSYRSDELQQKVDEFDDLFGWGLPSHIVESQQEGEEAYDFMGWGANARNAEWLNERAEADYLWGPFGKKKKWMDQHPNSTSADWHAEDFQKFEEIRTAKEAETLAADVAAYVDADVEPYVTFDEWRNPSFEPTPGPDYGTDTGDASRYGTRDGEKTKDGMTKKEFELFHGSPYDMEVWDDPYSGPDIRGGSDKIAEGILSWFSRGKSSD